MGAQVMRAALLAAALGSGGVPAIAQSSDSVTLVTRHAAFHWLGSDVRYWYDAIRGLPVRGTVMIVPDVPSSPLASPMIGVGYAVLGFPALVLAEPVGAPGRKAQQRSENALKALVFAAGDLYGDAPLFLVAEPRGSVMALRLAAELNTSRNRVIRGVILMGDAEDVTRPLIAAVRAPVLELRVGATMPQPRGARATFVTADARDGAAFRRARGVVDLFMRSCLDEVGAAGKLATWRPLPGDEFRVEESPS